MKIIGGKVLCSTCHGVHHSDSNSRTLDNFSSVIFNRISSSTGYLLRTDLKGTNASDRNICTNCHKTTDDDANAKVKSHNGTLKKQNIQCADCHGAHVDEVQYDADAGNSNPNVFLIKRFMAYTSAISNGRNPKVIFQYTSLSQRNYNKDKFGVCLACHKTLPDTIEQHKSPTTAATCEQCHTHKAGFSANCTDCHGMPPRVDIEGGPYGYGKGYKNLAGAVDESLSPHQSHAGGTDANNYYMFSCNECHKGNTHGNGTFQDVFKSLNGTKAGMVPPGYTTSYNPATRTCSNVYCHSNGVPVNRAPDFKQITWGNNINSIITLPPEQRCNSCHEAVPTTNAHTKHLTNGLLNGCVNCHANTVSDNTTLRPEARLTGGTHINGYKDRRFSGTIGGQVLDGTECSNVYCHSNGRGTTPITAPVWSDPSTGACGTCHFASAGSSRDTYAHFAHLSSAYGPLDSKQSPESCNSCHAYPTAHVDGNINFPDNATCTTNCHKNSPLPNWREVPHVRLACESCHAGNLSVIDGKTASDKSLFVAGYGHKKFGKACSSCHNPDSKHFNIPVNGNTKRLIPELQGATNVQCQYCHNNVSQVPTARFRNVSTHFMPADYGKPTATMACTQCHDVHGTTNMFSIRTSISFINSTAQTITFNTISSNTSFVLPNGRGLCQVCHTQTKVYRAGVTGQTHNISTNCLKCHKHGGPDGAFAKSGGGCDGCHGYPPIPKSSIRMSKSDPLYASTYKTTYGFSGNFSSARYEDYSGGGGAHLNHVPDFARPDDGWSRCAVCHSGGVNSPSSHGMSGNLSTDLQTITVNIDAAAKFNNSLQIIYSGARLVTPPDNKSGSCMNISCHYQPTPRWSKDR
ncbi:CxxxxCH/CxxCH domain-containing protein [Geobacter sp. OR-1]|uniref:CxxxxCH/CxxCH domain c-type cytochrome n=1 Tax=Geobacter sp. OR-1 TaxID=1266765 RepID=UPI001364D3C9|nr:CxxxxCH/CxxCH domain-containing protein [Geobacter sp. OR-1]